VTWESVPLGDLASIQGGIQKQPKRTPLVNRYPFLRVANVTAAGLDLRDVHEVELFGDELDRLRLQQGDLLVVEGNGSPSQIGRAVVWDGSINDCVHQNHLIRVRPGGRILPRFLGLVWNSPAVREELTSISSSSSGLHTLSVTKLRSIQLPLPPVAVQRRIVGILEDHLSRFEAADQYRRNARKRVGSLLLSQLTADHRTLRTPGVAVRTIGEIAETNLGKMLDAKRAEGLSTPYLANINVRWGSFALNSLKNVLLTDREREKFSLEPGDVLACEGGEPGRCAVWREPSAQIAFQKALHRIRVRDRRQVDADYLSLMLRQGIQSRRWDRLFTGTTIKHLPQEKLRAIELSVPDIEVQREVVARAQGLVDHSFRLELQLEALDTRETNLRKALLSAAFSGRLTGQQTDHEVIEELANV